MLLKKVRNFIIKTKWKLARLFEFKTVRSAYGPKFHANYDDATFQFYITGFYGKFLSNQISAIRQPFIFLDVGANQGLYSLIANQNVHCKAIYAFEPVAQTYKNLKSNIELNRANKVKVFNYAISNTSDSKQISFDPNHTGGASIEHKGASGATQQISCVCAKELPSLLMLDKNLDIFIKVDTEGHEPIVINELRKTPFWTQVKSVFFEADDDWYNSAELIKLLEGDGFKEAWRTASHVQHFDVLLKREL